MQKCCRIFVLGTILLFCIICSSAAEPETASSKANYQPGLVATVYVQPKQSGNTASKKPVGTPIGSFIDVKMPVFGFNSLMQDKEALSLWHGNNIGIQWDGYVRVEEEGNYVFMVIIKLKGYLSANGYACTLFLSGDKIIDKSKQNEPGGRFRGGESSEIAEVKLTKGYYPISIWLNCGITKDRYRYWKKEAMENLQFYLKVKRPSDRIIDLPPNDFFVWK